MKLNICCLPIFKSHSTEQEGGGEIGHGLSHGTEARGGSAGNAGENYAEQRANERGWRKSLYAFFRSHQTASDPAGRNESVVSQHENTGGSDANALENIAPAKVVEVLMEFLSISELIKVLPSGAEADRLSGMVPAHIPAVKEAARETRAVLAFRGRNQDASYWMRYGHFAGKGLGVKPKSQQQGSALGGLLVTEKGRKESTVSLLEGDVFGGFIAELLANERLSLVESEGESEWDENSPLKAIVVKEEDEENRRGDVYRFTFDSEQKKFKVEKKEGDSFEAKYFKAENGVPLTSDDDGFDWYLKLEKNLAGVKEINANLKQEKGGLARFRRLGQVIQNDVLELPDVRTQKEGLGRISRLDEYIKDVINRKIKQMTGYPHDAVRHGKEKRNTRYPEQCEAVFFVFPDGRTLMSTSWRETQAVDYAIQQEGFISTTNRVYNHEAGTRRLFPDDGPAKANGELFNKNGNGKKIKWDSRQAAKELYAEYIQNPDAFPRTVKKSVSNSVRSKESARSSASSIAKAEWLNQFVRRTSIAPSVLHSSPNLSRRNRQGELDSEEFSIGEPGIGVESSSSILWKDVQYGESSSPRRKSFVRRSSMGPPLAMVSEKADAEGPLFPHQEDEDEAP